jgi:hypothetical protein
LKKKNGKNNENTHVEFGMEFADINAAKQYEIPFINQKKGTKKK